VTSVTRRIGLSLGADLCWPACFEAIMKRLELAIPSGDDTIRFAVERVTIEPFDLRQASHYDLVIDRLTHWYATSREWIKKCIVMNDLYVFNNPWSIQANEKHTSYAAMMRLGMPVPDTWMIPPKAYEPTTDLEPTLQRYAKLFDVGTLGDRLGWPLFMKPYDGGGWRAVSRVASAEEARRAYEESGRAVMHAQASIEGYDLFVRTIGFGPQVRSVHYDPAAPLHDRYTTTTGFLSPADAEHLRKITLTINAYFGWEFNSCETLRRNGVWHPIDFANPCPDSQVTSLHFHFPWLVKAYVRWAVFCAATRRRMRKNLDWTPFEAIAARDLSYEEKLAAYARVADERFETARFEDFSAKHLAHLDEVAFDFFGSPEAKAIIRRKVEALYPQHEVEPFTELFWDRIQAWRSAGGP
jgi:hypothetical protein